MELSEYLGVLRKYWAVIGFVAVVGMVGAYLWSSSLTPTYRVSASVFVAVPHSETLGERVQAASYTERRIGSYAELATTPYVLDPVIERLGLDTSARSLGRSIEVSSPLDTDVLEIAVTRSDPEEAAEIANAVTAELARAVADLEGDGVAGEPAVQLTAIAAAERPSYPVSPNTRLYTATGLALGLALGVLAALARALLDTRVRTLKDVRRVTSAPLVTSVRRDRRARVDPLAMRSEPFGDRAEAYRRLRTNLRFLKPGAPSRSMLITSSVPGEGKSTTAANLAIAMADGAARILLVDADLRNPRLARLMGVEGGAGLTNVLIGEAEVEDVIQSWSESLDVLAAGPVPPNPAELLDSDAMAGVLEAARDRYDVVILDTPPLVPVTDAAALTRLVDGALLVVGCGTVHRPRLAEALASLDAVGANLVGLVLNRVTRAEAGATYVYGAEVRGRWGRRRPRVPGTTHSAGPRQAAALATSTAGTPVYVPEAEARASDGDLGDVGPVGEVPEAALTAATRSAGPVEAPRPRYAVDEDVPVPGGWAGKRPGTVLNPNPGVPTPSLPEVLVQTQPVAVVAADRGDVTA